MQRSHRQSQAVSAQAKFKMAPSVTKIELREFLEKVYGFPVIKIDTVIVQGRLRNVQDRPGQMRTMKSSDFKQAWVQFAKGSIETLASRRTELLRQSEAARAAAQTQERPSASFYTSQVLRQRSETPAASPAA